MFRDDWGRQERTEIVRYRQEAEVLMTRSLCLILFLLAVFVVISREISPKSLSRRVAGHRIPSRRGPNRWLTLMSPSRMRELWDTKTEKASRLVTQLATGNLLSLPLDEGISTKQCIRRWSLMKNERDITRRVAIVRSF